MSTTMADANATTGNHLSLRRILTDFGPGALPSMTSFYLIILPGTKLPGVRRGTGRLGRREHRLPVCPGAAAIAARIP